MNYTRKEINNDQYLQGLLRLENYFLLAKLYLLLE